jgi:hypothetical protein
VLFAGGISAQNDQKAEIEKLQKQLEQLQLQLAKDSVMKATLKQGIDYQTELNNYKSEIREENSKIKLLAWIFGGATILTLLTGLLQFFYGVRKQMETIVNQKIIEIAPKLEEKIRDEYGNKLKTEMQELINAAKTNAEAEIKKEATQLNRQIQVYDQEFAQVMETHRKQSELFKNKKITVVVENENRKAVIENYFFKLPKLGNPKFILKENFKGFEDVEELIIFDDLADSENSDTFYENILKNDNRQTNRQYLWFMKRQSTVINNPKYKTFVNSANSEITLYSRLIETIHYQNDFNG